MSWPGPESGWVPPPPGPPAAWGYYWARPPQNTVATVGMVCSIMGGALLVLSFGLLWTVTLPLSIAGLVCGIVGKRKLERGEVMGNRGVAMAAIIVGVVGIVLHVVVAVLFVVFFAAIIDALDEVDSTPGHDLQPAILALLARV